MTARRRDSRPTWAIWWLLPILTACWPLIAFAHYPSNGQPGQLTATGWAAETIWLLTLATLGAGITVARHRAATTVNPTGHPAPRAVNLTDTLGPAAVNPTDSLTGKPRPRREDIAAAASHLASSMNPPGEASKHNPGVTRGQGAERHPRRKDTPAPTA